MSTRTFIASTRITLFNATAAIAAPLATLIALTGITPTTKAAVPVYGGLTYDTDEFTGFTNANISPTRISSGSAAAIASGTVNNAGTLAGSGAQRITPSGATLLGHLGLSSTNRYSATAFGINPAGTAVGTSNLYESTVNLGLRAVKWEPASSTPITLPVLASSPTGASRAVAFAISPDGSAVGVSNNYAAGTQVGDVPVLWSPSGAITPLSTLGYTTNADAGTTGGTYANAINASGIIVGALSTTDSGNRAARWDSTGAGIELQRLGTGTARAYAINDAGDIVGTSAVSGLTRAVKWNATGTPTALGSVPSPLSNTNSHTSFAYKINAAGFAVGNQSFGGSNDTRAIVWAPDGSATALALPVTLVGDNFADAYSINDAGLIAGTSRFDNTTFINHATVWTTAGNALDLNSLIDPASGWTLTYAYNITNDNWISGIGTFDADGPGPLLSYTRAYLLQLPENAIAIPEPTTATLTLPALVLLRRRR